MSSTFLSVTVGQGNLAADVRIDRIEAVTEYAVITLSGDTYELGDDQTREQIIDLIGQVLTAAKPQVLR